MNGSDLLAHSALFASLPGREMANVEKRLVQRTFEKDEYLFFEGDPAEWLVFVAEGRVKMIKHSESGRETILATFGPGQIVGEVGVLVGEVYPATAQALEPAVTLSLRRDEYAELVQGNPDLAWALIKELGRRLQRAHETIRSLAVEKVERRVARVLLRMANTAGERLEDPPGAVRITVSLSRQDIADMAGTVIETAIRTMSKFQKQGLIETREGRIILLKPHQLVAIAEEL
jgi:CRP-like cAMP-binding protein